MIQPGDYTKNYFDPDSHAVMHPAGYSQYQYNIDDQAMHHRMIEKFNLVGKNVLEVGCAKGFFVKTMRDSGVIAYGLDGSAYAISKCDPSISDHVSEGILPEALSQYSDNQFHYLIGLRLLPCFNDSALTEFLNEAHRVSEHQIYLIDDLSFYHGQRELDIALANYNVKPFAEWETILSQYPNAVYEKVIRHGVNGSCPQFP